MDSKPKPLHEQLHEQRMQDEALGDAAMELRDALDNLLSNIKDCEDCSGNRGVDLTKEDTYWVSGNITHSAVKIAETLLERLRNA